MNDRLEPAKYMEAVRWAYRANWYGAMEPDICVLEDAGIYGTA